VEETPAKAKEFYTFLITSFGLDFTRDMLPHLARLLPTRAKRIALLNEGQLLSMTALFSQ
jgi:hypothetical protein